MKVSVIGLGKLGASMVAGFASKGIKVVGYDINANNVDKLVNKKAPVEETDLQSYIDQFSQNISATNDLSEAVSSTDASFIIVPTPSLKDGSFDLSYIKKSCEQIGISLKKNDKFHLVVITSTVLPGSTRNVLIPALEKASGKKAGVDFGVCYNPEFIALGSVIRDFLNPDFYLVGEFDQRSGNILEQIHNRVSDNLAPVKRLSIENAELAKISINSYVTLKISFANMLAGYCEKIEGGNIDSVTEALGMDTRIGNKYLKGGLGFAGPCFPRDNAALAQLGDKIGAYSGLLRENDRYNEQLTKFNLASIEPLIANADHVAILGLAYKPLSYITEKAPGIDFALALHERGINLSLHDPLSEFMDLSRDGLNQYLCNDINEALKPNTLILLTHPTDAYKNALMKFSEVNDCTIVDFWRALEIPFARATVRHAGTDIGTGKETLKLVYEKE